MKKLQGIKNCRLITENGIIANTDIAFDGEMIKSVGENSLIGGFDAGGKYVSAGFVDIHTHGGYGFDFMDCTEQAFDGITSFHLSSGTTSLLATTKTAPIDRTVKTIEFCRNYIKKCKYANILGIHLEGPFLSQKNKGAQNGECILSPQTDSYDFIMNNADIVKTVTIAPEADIYGKMTKELTDKGIVVCGGHDDGHFPNFMPSVKNGLKHLTHMYCAMSGVEFKDGKRNIGLREYGLYDDNLTAEIIADNRHIPPMLAKLIIKCKGADSVCVVSDSLRAAGCTEMHREFLIDEIDGSSARKFCVREGVAVMCCSNTYAGSIQPVSQMVKNLIDMQIDIVDAFKMATITPARIIGDTHIGRVAPGYCADLCIFDSSFNLINVIKNGNLVNRSNA